MADNNPPKTPEQIHYDNLTDFFKWAIGIAGTFIGLIAGVAIISSYNDRNAMRLEYTNALSELRGQIIEIKNDAKDKAKEIQDDAKDVVKDTRESAEAAVKSTKENAENTIKTTREDAENDIAKIRLSTNEIALQETQKQIDAIFKTDKIQNLIVNQATKEIKNKVSEIVDDETKNINRIADAGNKMREGDYDGMLELKSYFENQDNSSDSRRAKDLYDKICDEYEKYALIKFNPNNKPEIDVNKPLNALEKDKIQGMVSYINARPYNLTALSSQINTLSNAVGKKFKFFDINAINEWYNGLKK